jgi:hypothetical protein
VKLTDETLTHLGVTPQMIEAVEELLLDEERGEFGQPDREWMAKAVLCAAMACESAPSVRTPLHDLVDLCREQGFALDFSIYGPDEGQHPDSDDTKSTYMGGARLTGHKGDPMDVIRAGVRAQRDAAEERGT